MNNTKLFVAAVDVGRFNNWGIAANDPRMIGVDSTRMKGLAKTIALELNCPKHRVAFGFEAPLWVPARCEASELLESRSGEKSHPWSAGAGATVLSASLAVVPWWLREIKKHLSVEPRGTTNPGEWEPGILLIWEAFVSGKKKKDSNNGKNVHDADAQAAVDAFIAKEKLESDFTIEDKSETFSLIPAMFERFGWKFIGDVDLPAMVVDASLHKSSI